jgi:alkylated DNA repair dioxygenase AlkB
MPLPRAAAGPTTLGFASTAGPEQKDTSRQKGQQVKSKARRMPHYAYKGSATSTNVLYVPGLFGWSEEKFVDWCDEEGGVAVKANGVAYQFRKTHAIIEFSSVDEAVKAWQQLAEPFNSIFSQRQKYEISFSEKVLKKVKGKVNNNPKSVSYCPAHICRCLPHSLLPQGLAIEENFITEAQELALVRFFKRAENDCAWETKIKRRVQHYGYEFNYQSLKHNRDCVRPIPEELQIGGLDFGPDAGYNQVTVNEYQPGVGIAPHVETHSCFEEGFCSVSLLSGIAMELTYFGDDKHTAVGPPRGAAGAGKETAKRGEVDREKSCPQRHDGVGHEEDGREGGGAKGEEGLEGEEEGREEEGREERHVSIYLPPRSRITFCGESRLAWKHSISMRRTDLVYAESESKQLSPKLVQRALRISLTYRRIKDEYTCSCHYPHLCDSQTPASLQTPDRIWVHPKLR